MTSFGPKRVRQKRALVCVLLFLGTLAACGDDDGASPPPPADGNVAFVDMARTDEVLQTSLTLLPKLLSYDFDTVDQQLLQLEPLTAEPFRSQYSGFYRSNVVPLAKQHRIRATTTVTAESVITAVRDEWTLLLFLNQETRTAAAPDPVHTGSRIRVTLVDDGGAWKVSKLDPV